MENLIGKKLVGSRTGRIIQAKAVGEDVVLSIQRDGHPGVLSVQFSKEEVEALQRGEEVAGFRISAEEHLESIKTSGYGESGKRTAAEKYLYVNNQIREALERENTAIAKRVLDYLNRDLVRVVLEEDTFYFETPSYASLPDYVHDYLVKKCEEILGVPYYHKGNERTSDYKNKREETRELIYDNGKGVKVYSVKEKRFVGDDYTIEDIFPSAYVVSIEGEEERRFKSAGEAKTYLREKLSERGELYSSETEKRKKSAQSDFVKKLKELLDKWYKKGIEAGKNESWMNVEETLSETLEKMPELDDPVNLVWTDMEAWEETDHFSILYGRPMVEDISEVFEDEDKIDALVEVKTKFWEGYLQGRKEIGIDIYEEAKKLISEKSKRGVSGKSTTVQEDSKIALLIRKRIASGSRIIAGQNNPTDRPEGLFTRKEIEDLLKEMKTYYTDGEIESGKYILSIEITKDSAGEEGWVYGWDLGVLTGDGEDVDYWVDGDGYFYSDEELIDSLIKAGIVV